MSVTASTPLDRIVKHQPAQRWLGLVLLCLATAATGYVGKTMMFSILVFVAALSAVFLRIRFQADTQRRLDIVGGLGIVFTIKYFVAADNVQYLGLFPSQQIAFTVSQFFLVLLVTECFIRRTDDRLPVYFPAMGVGALVCAAIVEVTPRERDVYQCLCVAFAVVAALFCDSSRKFLPVPGRKSVGRPLAALASLIAVALTGWSAATLLHRYEKEMDRFVMNFITPGGNTTGFSDTTRLGSVSFQKGREENRIALRIDSITMPGYVRGRAFDEYRDQQWLTVPSGRVLTPQSMRPGLLPDAVHTGQLFRIANLRSSLAKRLTVWPSRSLSGTFFAPGGVRYLESSAEMPTVDAFGILRADNVVPETPYSVFTDDVMTHDARSAANVTEERAQMMTTPPDWAVTDPGLRSLAAEVFSGSQTPGQKIGAVKEWFARHGRYGQEVDVPNDVSEDSVAWFLKENPPAHCEYFASGTAVLLRMAGVQCRYVTGFLVTEQNRYGAGWMARNRDAHAWVEAWDGESQWIIVETTPGDGIPSGAVTGAWQQFYEYTLGSLQRFRAAWQQRRFGLLGDLLMLVVTTPIGIISLTALFALAVRKRCYRFWLAGSSARSRKGSKHSLRLQSTFRAVDRLAHRIATPRARGETLMAFAGRLDEVAGASTVAVRRTADWYRNYSTLLYRGEQTDHESEVLYSEGRRLLPVLRQFKRPQGETPTSDTLEDQ